MSPRSTAPRGSRLLLGLAAVAVMFAAADTYVVVLALPDMMAGVGLSVDELQRAAPIVSGFLLGYVAVLPLVGRIADVRGRVPVLVGTLLLFALGSLVTAAAYDLPSMVVGRFLQGVGGGGLVPATLALVADLYPAHRRGVPLGVVGAVQEVGSVLGPLYGALVLTVADWHAIFALNLAVGLVLAAVLRAVAGRGSTSSRGDQPSPAGLLLLGLALAAMVLAMVRPPRLAADVTLGLGFVPLLGDSRWLAPVGLAAVLVGLAFVAHCLTSRRPVLPVREWVEVTRRADLLGATLLAVALSGVVLAFASADPEVSALSPVGPWLLLGSAAAAALLVLHLRRSPAPLLPRGAVAAPGAWGALVVNLFVGSALIAALVDVPLFARITVYPASQLDAALVLLRFLVALPVGALLGGYATRRLAPGPVTAAGMLLATGGFAVMSTWGLTSLREPVATAPLVLAGLGFGVAVAPVNASLLAATDAAVHGVSSAMLVVARMVGMLVGISALTAIGLRRYYAAQAALPAPTDVCPTGTQCASYTRLLKEAGLEQLHAVFVGAAVCAVVAAVAALLTLRNASAGSGTLPR